MNVTLRRCAILALASALLSAFGATSATQAQTTPASRASSGAASRGDPNHPDNKHPIPVPSAMAAEKRGSLVFDGKVDDAAWAAATPVTDFKQYDPDHDQPATEAIDVRFLYDDGALYVGARLSDRLGAKGVTSTVVRRDAFFNSDYFEVVIDGFHDHLGRAFFQVNPSGSKTDMLGTGVSCCDSGWDPVWDAKTYVDSTGWQVEMRIPFNQLRFSRDSIQTWGLQIRRYLKRRNETDQWSMWGRTENGGPARFGHLEGVRVAHAPGKLEILPYIASQASRVASEQGDPFHAGTQSKARVGLDLKYLLTPNLTLDATVNPDFGQVEVDPAVVNLSAFENFFQERRPFFVSGAGVFDFGSFRCHFCSNVSNLQAFYSRRVGRAPTGSDLAYADGPYADVPQSSPILGAAKVTGRTANGYTIGLLNAVTGRTNADVQRVDGTKMTQEVEPLANYFVGRLKKDYKRGDLVIGAIGTSLARNLDDQFTPRLTRHAELLGGDWQYRWDNSSYSFMGSVAASSIAGDSRVITARQRASARFYQRPDRTPGTSGFFSTALDTTATELRGYGGYARVAKEAGDWMWETAVNFRNPGFETNDYSFLTNADYIWNNANVVRSWSKPTKWYRSMLVIVGGQTQRNFEGDLTDNSQAHTYFQYTTPNFWSVNTFLIRRADKMLSDRLLRGGPSVRTDGFTYFSTSIESDSRKQWQFATNPTFATTPLGGYQADWSFTATVQPSTRTFVSFGPSYNSGLSKLQYVRSVDDATATLFSGKRYVLSDIDQRQLGLDTRVNVTFTPTMTLELYAQPFIASGHYSAFKEYNAPRTRSLSVYGVDKGTVQTTTGASGAVSSYTIDPDGSGPAAPFTMNNPDFNFRSLRGSAVFRWEYRPGSALYFVWTQQRSDQGPMGDFDWARDRTALFSAHPDNVFLIKASWWLAR